MIPIFIPFVNRIDLLNRCLDSVPVSLRWKRYVINNSDVDLPSLAISNVLEPSVPLTFAQTQNWMLKLAEAWKAPFYLFMHNDAQAGEGTVDKLVDMARELTNEGRKWGVIFTAYDALAAFNTKTFREVGGWDPFIEWYVGDNDIYHRIRLAGYETIDSNLPVNHTPSQTLNSDPLIRLQVDIMFPCRGAYYFEKWGGHPGHEKFNQPFSGRFNP